MNLTSLQDEIVTHVGEHSTASDYNRLHPYMYFLPNRLVEYQHNLIFFQGEVIHWWGIHYKDMVLAIK